MIGIIGAMQSEVTYLIEMMANANKKSFAGVDFYTGTLCGKEVVVAESGIGKVNAGVCAALMIDKFTPSQIINAGVAGAISPELTICDAVISKNLYQYDFDITDAGDPHGYPYLNGTPYVNADEEIVKKLTAASQKLVLGKTCVGTVLTADRFNGSEQKANDLYNTYKGLCCECEGAAIGQICERCNVPFAVLRTISDNARDEAGELYRDNVIKAAKLSSQIMLEYLKL